MLQALVARRPVASPGSDQHGSPRCPQPCSRCQLPDGGWSSPQAASASTGAAPWPGPVASRAGARLRRSHCLWRS